MSKIEITAEQLDFLKRFIVKYDDISVGEYLTQEWWCEDYEREDMEKLYREYPELMYMIEPFFMYRLQKFYNNEFMCAGWCGVFSLSQIYKYAKEFEIE